MEVAINHYGMFEAASLDLYLNRNDTFIVTPKIKKSKQFQLGLARKKFEIIEVTDLADVQRAVNVTDKIIENFRKMLTTDSEPEEQTPPAEPETPPEGEHPPEEEGEKTEEPPKEEEAPKEEDDKVDEGAGEEEQDPVLPFTEAAGNVDKATAVVEKETDIEKLKFALEHDSRVTVKTAIEIRLKELEA